MVQLVRVERPPLFAEIDAKFHIADKPILFAWGDTIYNPCGVPINPELHAHEAVHGARQLDYLARTDPGPWQGQTIEAWWREYIDNTNFRLAEEILAHRAEYQHYVMHNPNGRVRNNRRMVLDHIARKLSSPLYGRLCGYHYARVQIKDNDGRATVRAFV